MHETNYNSPQPQVGNPQEYDPLPTLAPPVDPYSDPYNKYSGYRKQKGYPPRNNHPSSSRYNPYKVRSYTCKEYSCKGNIFSRTWATMGTRTRAPRPGATASSPTTWRTTVRRRTAARTRG